MTVMKWLGAAAVAVAVLGAPVVYHNKKLKEAYEQGHTVGKAECEKIQVAQLREALTKANEVAVNEALKAEAFERKKAELAIKASKLEQKLNEELAKTPKMVGCLLSRDITSVLRESAVGNYEDHPNPYDSISDDPNAEVRGESQVPRSG